MRLSLHSDLGFRTLVYLASADENGGTIAAIAAAYSVSENHLRKVVHELVQHGLIVSQRGRNGGIRLGRKPEEIGIGAVMRLLEPDFALVDCMGNDPARCVLTGNCGLQDVFSEALGAWLAVLDRHTLADAIGGSHHLPRILGIQIPIEVAAPPLVQA